MRSYGGIHHTVVDAGVLILGSSSVFAFIACLYPPLGSVPGFLFALTLGLSLWLVVPLRAGRFDPPPEIGLTVASEGGPPMHARPLRPPQPHNRWELVAYALLALFAAQLLDLPRHPRDPRANAAPILLLYLVFDGLVLARTFAALVKSDAGSGWLAYLTLLATAFIAVVANAVAHGTL